MCHVLNAMLLQTLPSLFPWKHNKTKMMAEPVMEEVGSNIAEDDLRPCKICGRTFLPAPLVKHTKICEKNATKKRNIFNSLRQRVEGTDLALFHQKTYLKKNREQSPTHSVPTHFVLPSPVPIATSCVRGSKPTVIESIPPPQKEMKVVESIQANRSAESLKPVPSVTAIRKTRSSALMANSTFERCPGCDRQFGPKAYDRHVEWCKEKMSRLPSSNLINNQVAKERLEMRTKYRVPPINKNKKTVKEKYQMTSGAPPISGAPSAASPQSPGVSNVNSMSNLNRKPNLQRNPSVRQAPGSGSTSNLNSPFANSTDSARYPSNRRKSEPLKAKRPTVSVLKINTVAVNDKSGLTVSNIHTPSSSSSRCTTQSEPVTRKHPTISPKNLISWKEGAEYPANTQKCVSKEPPEDPPPITNDTTKIIVDIELPKITYDIAIDDSDASNELQEEEMQEAPAMSKLQEIKEPPRNIQKSYNEPAPVVMNTDEIDLNYVRTCLDSNNFQMMKLSDTNHLQSNMLLISTKPQQGTSDDNVYIVIKQPSSITHEHEAVDIGNQPEVQSVGSNASLTSELNTKKSSSKIPIRSGIKKPNYSDTNISNLGSNESFQKHFFNALDSEVDSGGKKQLEFVEHTCPKDQCEENDNACKRIFINTQCMNNVSKLDEMIEHYENKSIYNLVQMDSHHTQANLELDQDEFKIDEDRDILDVEATPVVALRSDNNKKHFFAGIEEAPDDVIYIRGSNDKDDIDNIMIYPIKRVVEDDTDIGAIAETSGEDLTAINLFKTVDRHPDLHSETDFQLKKARDVLYLPTYSNIQVFDDKTRFDTYFDWSGMGDVGSPKSARETYQESRDTETAQGDSPQKLEVLPDLAPEPASIFHKTLCDSPRNLEMRRCKFVPPLSKPTNTIPCDQLNCTAADSVIFERYGKLTEVESLHGIYCNMYSSVLSKTRLERELRGCCSEVTLNSYNSDASQMMTASETDLLKFNHLQDMMRNHYEEHNRTHDGKIEKNRFHLRISQGTQPDLNVDRNESVQTENKIQKAVDDCSTNTTGKDKASDTCKYMSSSGLQKHKCDESNDEIEANKSSPLENDSTKKEKEGKDKDVPFATRIYENCLHHNIIKIKLRKNLHDKQEHHLKDISTQKGMNTSTVRTNAKASKIEPNPGGSTHSITKCSTCETYNADAEITDSECSSISKLSPRFQSLVDVILHENRSEVFRLSRKDCKRLIKLNPKKISGTCQKSEIGLKLPKITMVIPKADSNDGGKRIYKSTVHTLPRISESCSTKTTIINSNNNNTKNENKNATNTPDSYNPFVTAERQLMELLECDDFKHLNNNKPKIILAKNQLNTTASILNSISPIPTKPISSSTPKQNKRQSVIDPPLDFKDMVPNPQDDIDFEMLENFINDNFGNDELMHKLDLDTISLASCSTKTDNTVSFYDDVSIDPRLINDFDNLSIPDHLHTETTTTPDRFRLEPLDHQAQNRNTSISSDSSFADLATAPQYNVHENKKKSNLRRSLFTDPVKPGKGLKNRSDVQRYFDGNESSSPRDNCESKDDNREFDMVAAGGSDELFSVDDEMYEEYKKYEEMYLMEKEEQLKREAEIRANDDTSNQMISADSAYGSLNRSGKTKVRSKITKLSPMEPTRADSASSSGSETCIMQNAPEHQTPMTANAMSNYSSNSASANKNNNSKLSKFCHECGNRYPLTTAKFCVECGVRRLPEIDKGIKSENEDHNKDL